MKRFLNLFILVFVLLLTTSCNIKLAEDKYQMIMPTGTPSIALSYFVKNNKNVEAEIASGSDPLVAAFKSGNYDIIVAPVNLGAMLYNQLDNFAYSLYQPIVGCNFYVMSTNPISSFAELDGKELIAFNEAATPGVMIKALTKYYNISPNVTYVGSVNEANSYLVSGRAEYILSAEPSRTIISTKGNFYSLDISQEWIKTIGNYNVPQAGIFVKNDNLKKSSFRGVLTQMSESVKAEPALMAEAVKEIDPNFKTAPSLEALTKAIPNCHFITTPLNKEEVNVYFSVISDLGLAKSIGGKLPDEKFYYSEN